MIYKAVITKLDRQTVITKETDKVIFCSKTSNINSSERPLCQECKDVRVGVIESVDFEAENDKDAIKKSKAIFAAMLVAMRI